MRIVDIIQKKVDRKRYTQEDFDAVIDGIVDKSIPDYLITTWLMAIYMNGLNIDEAYYLTKSMWEHSAYIDLTKHGKTVIDKHSTGGIGDKVSLILLPIIASFGLSVAKISGRGLGFTGGTIDKLEAVGVKTELNKKQMLNLLNKHQIFITTQTEDIAPVDKVLYHLRDVTGTVGDYGLIASSILSKKFAILGTHVFLDVKYGSGAFCPTYFEALKLVKFLRGIAKRMGRKLTIIISGMNQPLGRCIGNAIEVLEAQDFLSGNVDYTPDLKQLIYKLAAVILRTYKDVSFKQAMKLVDKQVKSGKALEKFYEWISAQGGDIELLKTRKFFNPKYRYIIKAKRSGFLSFVSNSAVGMMSTKLGAGRILKTDKIDPQAGLWFHFKSGDRVKKGQAIVDCVSSKPINAKEIEQEFNYCCKISSIKPIKLAVVRKVIDR
ncbi:MAG: thymidine phosphorylase [Mycoplasmoidaceae bacterium]